MAKNFKAAKVEFPIEPPKRWWDTLPGPIAAWSAALVAAIGVISAAIALFHGLFPGVHQTSKDVVGNGDVGWIYVGSRLGDAWAINKADDPTQPLVTLNLDGLPARATTYSVKGFVNLRKEAPNQPQPLQRPTMPPLQGVLSEGRTVVVDDMLQYQVKGSDGRIWTWVWVHVTVKK